MASRDPGSGVSGDWAPVSAADASVSTSKADRRAAIDMKGTSWSVTEAVNVADRRQSRRLRADTWTALGLGCTIVLLAAVWVLGRRPRPIAARRGAVFEALLLTVLAAIALDFRFGHVGELNAGRLTMDEAFVARSNVSSVVHFEPNELGAT